jgi:hypothetical protein
MNPKPILKASVPVVLGVLIAGMIMHNFRDVGVIAQSRAGYGV